MTTTKLAGLLVDVVRLRERVAYLKANNGSYLLIDHAQQRLQAKLAALEK